jgi:hypothetical protein
VDTPATIALIGFALIVGAYLISRLIGAMRVNRRPSIWIYGDVVHLPDAARIARGEGARRSARLAQNDAIARLHEGRF